MIDSLVIVDKIVLFHFYYLIQRV